MFAACVNKIKTKCPCTASINRASNMVVSVRNSHNHEATDDPVREPENNNERHEVKLVMTEKTSPCQMCEVEIPNSKMVEHLLNVHDIRVIDVIEHVNNDAAKSIQCHHCEAKLSTIQKLKVHLNEKHSGQCKVC